MLFPIYFGGKKSDGYLKKSDACVVEKKSDTDVSTIFFTDLITILVIMPCRNQIKSFATVAYIWEGGGSLGNAPSRGIGRRKIYGNIDHFYTLWINKF